MRRLCSLGAFFALIVSVASEEECMVSGRRACTTFGCWPSTWVIGCQKCGSTSLSALLHETHVACYANLTGVNEGKDTYFRKETHFWDGVKSGHVKDWRYFVELYPKRWTVECESFMEATPGYLANVEVAPLLFRTMPTVVRTMSKMVVVLREPLARDLSAYNHQILYSADWSHVCLANEAGSFENMIECTLDVYRKKVRRDDVASEDPDRILRGFADFRKDLTDRSLWGSLYVNHLREWVRYFDRSQFFVVSFEQLFVDSEGMDDLFSFVRSKSTSLDEFVFEIPHENSPEQSTKQATVDCAIADLLYAEIYDYWNEKLYSMLDEDRRFGRAPALEPEFRHFDKFLCSGNSSYSM